MKNYATRRVHEGKTAYRTPIRKIVPRMWDLASRLERRRVKGKRNRK